MSDSGSEYWTEIVCRGADGVYRQGPDADVLDENGQDPDGNDAAELLTAVEYDDMLYLDEALPQETPSYTALVAARREISSAKRLRARVMGHLRECDALNSLAEARLEQERDELALQNIERLLRYQN
ncbi:MAG: hypothetical protein AAB386_01520 [Patescibacteria group bacterium]